MRYYYKISGEKKIDGYLGIIGSFLFSFTIRKRTKNFGMFGGSRREEEGGPGNKSGSRDSISALLRLLLYRGNGWKKAGKRTGNCGDPAEGGGGEGDILKGSRGYATIYTGRYLSRKELEKRTAGFL